MIYPPTRIEATEDGLAGVAFPDPYRWLEAPNGEVQAWQRAQAELASANVRDWPPFDRLRTLVTQLSIGWQHGDQYRGLPRYAAGRWFRISRAQAGTQAIVADDPMGDGDVLFDSAGESPQPFLSWIAPSPDGRTLALGVCTDGSENNTIRLIDVATGQTLPDPPRHTLMDSWTGGAQWLGDSSGFFFSAVSGNAVDFQQGVYLHRCKPAPLTVPADVRWAQIRGTDYRWVVVSVDGRHAVALQDLMNPFPVAVAALDEESLRWRPFVTRPPGRLAGHLMGDRYIAITEQGAPRGRLIAIPLDAEDPDDVSLWCELVPESDAVLLTLTSVGKVLYLTELVGAYARVRILDLQGAVLGEVPLPEHGALAMGWMLAMHSTMPKGHPNKFLFSFSSPSASPGIYCHTPGHTPGKNELETLQAPQVRLENTVVEDLSATSADGTCVPYHLVRRSDVSPERPQPVLIFAYGGYGVPFVPQFAGPIAAFIAVGGMLVYAHVRGGGEFGLKWWQDGQLIHKQNTYDDLYAIAEDLIDTHRTTRQLLAVTGRSNGGLLASVALTQRPDLWKVVVPQVPLTDLIGGCRDAYGRMAIVAEHADDGDPDEVRRLATLSPYHLVRDGVNYPAVFITAGATDPRCPAWHARKLAARLQQASTGSAPILLHVWENSGHGSATDKATLVTDYTEWLAFILRHLGIDNWSSSCV